MPTTESPNSFEIDASQRILNAASLQDAVLEPDLAALCGLAEAMKYKDLPAEPRVALMYGGEVPHLKGSYVVLGQDRAYLPTIKNPTDITAYVSRDTAAYPDISEGALTDAVIKGISEHKRRADKRLGSKILAWCVAGAIPIGIAGVVERSNALEAMSALTFGAGAFVLAHLSNRQQKLPEALTFADPPIKLGSRETHLSPEE